MKKYKVVNAQVGKTGYHPFAITINAEIELLSDDGEHSFLSMSEVEGMPTLYQKDVSKFNDLMSLEEVEAEEQEQIGNSDVIYQEGNYDDLFENREIVTPYESLRYLIYIITASWEETNDFIAKTKGKYLDEIEIPKSDQEKEWEEEINA